MSYSGTATDDSRCCPAAAACQHEGLDLFRRLGDQLGQSWALSGLADMHLATGDYPAALELALAAGTDTETVFTKLVSLLGSGKQEALQVLSALGWRAVEVANAKPVWRRDKEKREPRRRDRPRKSEPLPDPTSPFARLAVLRTR